MSGTHALLRDTLATNAPESKAKLEEIGATVADVETRARAVSR
jgi:hypothetical protein